MAKCGLQLTREAGGLAACHGIRPGAPLTAFLSLWAKIPFIFNLSGAIFWSLERKSTLLVFLWQTFPKFVSIWFLSESIQELESKTERKQNQNQFQKGWNWVFLRFFVVQEENKAKIPENRNGCEEILVSSFSLSWHLHLQEALQLRWRPNCIPLFPATDAARGAAANN